MLAAAAEAAAALPRPPQLLAVTLLTSLDPEQLAMIGIPSPALEQVRRLAHLADRAGIPGLVCSPEEIAEVRQFLPDMTLVIPGIRPSGAAIGDQKRIATPASAIRDGASYLVVGRPITRAADPLSAAQAILQEIADALPG